jgi:hypothetical protein
MDDLVVLVHSPLVGPYMSAHFHVVSFAICFLSASFYCTSYLLCTHLVQVIRPCTG